MPPAPPLNGKPLVLLARLLLSSRPLARQELLGFLWPNKAEARARGSLRQALHTIRTVVGPTAVAASRSAVALVEPVPTDLTTFLQAVRTADDWGAVTAYGGPFLESTVVRDAAEAEFWIDIERRQLATLFEQSAVRLLHTPHTAADADRRIALALQLRDGTPDSAAYWALLLEALRRAGREPERRLELGALAARLSVGAIKDVPQAQALLAE